MSRSALVVIPTYNERANVPTLVAGLMAHENVRVLIVDDQSPDGTGTVAEELAAQHPNRIMVLHRTGKRGFGRSYIDGMRLALNEPVDVVCQMDADLSHDPRQLPDLIAATDHADVVIGSRYVPGGAILNWPMKRRVLSRVANIYIRTVTRLSVRDCTTGYRCWRKTALATLPLDQFISDGYSFLVEMLFIAARRGCRITEVPITFVERREGESKVSRAVLLESAITPWRLISNPESSRKARRSESSTD
ncbi:MAG: polyprenol monophosphomannose synthase [Acidobacteriaceae bacterium]|jgi:dolichol-phosphate mannosyltransferase|nr:polyprenol monophosphomannose synthase [Acidobacteriaceae bacterium]